MWTSNSPVVTYLRLEKLDMEQLTGFWLVKYLQYLGARRDSPVERNVTVDVQTASRETVLLIHPLSDSRDHDLLIINTVPSLHVYRF